jgi:hypothetical protein
VAETRFNIPMASWELAVDQLYGMLEEVARRGPRTTITYGEVVDRLTAVRLEPDSHAFHHMLGDVSTRSFDASGPLLSAVVVHKDDGRPGGGFCKCARGLGFPVDTDRAAEEAFWGQQLEAVYAWWRTR